MQIAIIDIDRRFRYTCVTFNKESVLEDKGRCRGVMLSGERALEDGEDDADAIKGQWMKGKGEIWMRGVLEDGG